MIYCNKPPHHFCICFCLYTDGLLGPLQLNGRYISFSLWYQSKLCHTCNFLWDTCRNYFIPTIFFGILSGTIPYVSSSLNTFSMVPKCVLNRARKWAPINEFSMGFMRLKYFGGCKRWMALNCKGRSLQREVVSLSLLRLRSSGSRLFDQIRSTAPTDGSGILSVMVSITRHRILVWVSRGYQKHRWWAIDTEKRCGRFPHLFTRAILGSLRTHFGVCVAPPEVLLAAHVLK